MARPRNSSEIIRQTVPLEKLKHIEPASRWADLCDCSTHPSIVQHPGWLGPMHEILDKGGQHGARIVQARAREHDRALSGLVSLVVDCFACKLPGHRIARTWDAGFLMSGFPLLERTSPGKALEALLQQSATELDAAAIVMNKVPEYGQLTGWLNERGIAHEVFDRHERAALLCDTGYANWFAGNFSRKRRKEYNRLRKRLAGQGRMQTETLRPGDDPDIWVGEFCALEAAGWKGRRGTAIAANRNKVVFLKQAFSRLHKHNILRFWKISLDGKPVAMLFGFVVQDRAWLGKIAYDETMSQYSPGVQVILDATRTFLDEENIRLADSCADPNHPMIDNIWRARLPVGDVLMSAPSTGPDRFARIRRIESIRRTIRMVAKKGYRMVHKGIKQ